MDGHKAMHRLSVDTIELLDAFTMLYLIHTLIDRLTSGFEEVFTPGQPPMVIRRQVGPQAPKLWEIVLDGPATGFGGDDAHYSDDVVIQLGGGLSDGLFFDSHVEVEEFTNSPIYTRLMQLIEGLMLDLDDVKLPKVYEMHVYFKKGFTSFYDESFNVVSDVGHHDDHVDYTYHPNHSSQVYDRFMFAMSGESYAIFDNLIDWDWTVMRDRFLIEWESLVNRGMDEGHIFEAPLSRWSRLKKGCNSENWVKPNTSTLVRELVASLCFAMHDPSKMVNFRPTRLPCILSEMKFITSMDKGSSFHSIVFSGVRFSNEKIIKDMALFRMILESQGGIRAPSRLTEDVEEDEEEEEDESQGPEPRRKKIKTRTKCITHVDQCTMDVTTESKYKFISRYARVFMNDGRFCISCKDSIAVVYERTVNLLHPITMDNATTTGDVGMENLGECMVFSNTHRHIRSFPLSNHMDTKQIERCCDENISLEEFVKNTIVDGLATS